MKTCRKPLLLVLLVFLGTEARADTYSYVDAAGTMVFTDDPAKVPLKREGETDSGQSGNCRAYNERFKCPGIGD